MIPLFPFHSSEIQVVQHCHFSHAFKLHIWCTYSQDRNVYRESQCSICIYAAHTNTWIQDKLPQKFWWLPFMGMRWGSRKRSLPSGLELTFLFFPDQLYGPQRQQKWIFPGASFSMGHRSLECLEIPAGAPLKHWGKCYSKAQACPPQSQTQFGLWEMVRMSLSLGKSQCMATDFQTALLGVRVGEREWGEVAIHFPYVFICREKSSLIYICKVWKPMHQLLLNYLLPLISLWSFYSEIHTGPQTCSSLITWELIRNAGAQLPPAPPQTFSIKVFILSRSPSDLYIH